ncbi:protoporphyrinogen/coproporphyrinogen oxidase [Paenibacillus radicis (ex Xue et al. 2023)]|uniref:NAD(P)-binding protein n=1 Tax=Paenibacillus radicis (ex Xue et al. 2023) TaxID=2972489 RepID=A0ABT1YJI1_9BACL|nr:NAD(P)-binding protein [Paenibacillus radicis (ex Xue et al. 2023)]MCR8633349.1 NAD(P)-binding protein [Paenibacillus radicis (ex Xue et al. 2023)]
MTIHVIGAGVTGLSFAKACSEEVNILEACENVGGKALSYKVETKVGTFGFDIGGHWFHYKSTPAVLDILEGLELQAHTRNAFVYLHEHFFKFPIQQSYIGHPDKKFVNDVKQELQSVNNFQEYNNYEEMLLQSYGLTLYESFFKDYNSKMYGIYDLSAIGVGKFETIRNVRTHRNITGYNGDFLYPKGDIGASGIPFFLADNLKINYKKKVKSINIKNKTMVINNERVSWDTIVSTIPLNSLIGIISDVDDPVLELSKQLKSSRGMILNLGVKKTHLQGDMSWVYFPDPNLHFYRVGFYSNVESSLAPVGYCSMYVECSPLFFSNKEEALANIPTVIKELIEIGFIRSADEIVTTKAFYLAQNYCLPDTSKTKVIHHYLENAGIYSIGRYGSWHWSSQHEDMQQAWDLANKLALRDLTKAKKFPQALVTKAF